MPGSLFIVAALLPDITSHIGKSLRGISTRTFASSICRFPGIGWPQGYARWFRPGAPLAAAYSHNESILPEVIT